MLKKIAFSLFLFCMASGSAMCQSSEQENNLKAVFLYNFTRYIDWEEHPGENEFVIGIMGTSGIDAALAEIAKTNTVNNKRIVLRHFSKPEDISFCHILFIPNGNNYPLGIILENIDKGVLTVSEKPGLGKMGTAFNFVVQHDKLKFEANLKAISAAGLKASSQLLKLAIIIN